jgi:hypothetical protein
MSENVFPELPRPSAIKKSRSYPIIDSDLTTEADLERLALQVFFDPDATFYYYCLKGSQPNPLFQSSGDLYWDETEFFYYQHHSERDFVRIPPPPDGTFRWDWEREYVETRPEFVRRILKLSQRKRLQLETIERFHVERTYREQIRRANTYDVFLSFADANRDEARLIEAKLTAVGQNVFLSPKELRPGDDFADRIRDAIHDSGEVWLLVTPQSLKSEWVTTEWGAAWVLRKIIVPILFRCDPDDLPARLKRLQCIDLHSIDDYITERFKSK